jgi:ATP-dependent Clp protease, protease subunit
MKFNRRYFDIKTDTENKVAEVYIYGIIGLNWYSEESRCAFEFVNEFKQAEKSASRINIHINSPGGVIEEGLPIFNVINASKVETHCYIDGIAYSMAAIIALAADKVHIAPNGLFLLHNASGWASGNARDFRSTADDLDKYDTALITSITAKTGLSEEQVRSNWFNYDDHLFTARQAIQAKLVDVITNDPVELPEDFKSWDLEKVHDFFSIDAAHASHENFFNQLLTKVKAALKSNPPTNNLLPMKELDKFVKAFNLSLEDLSVDNVIAAIQQQMADSVSTLTAERDQLVNDLAGANRTITDNIALIDSLGEEVVNAVDLPAKIQALKTKLNSKPGAGPTHVAGASDDTTTDQVDWEAINALSHNKAADQL